MFKYFNPNPTYNGKTKQWNKVDCAVRALCKATSKDWQQVYKELCEVGSNLCDMPNATPVVQAYLENNGFEKHSYKRGKKRETVTAFCKNHKGVAVLVLANHFTCCATGNYYDVWDCGNKTAYFYYMKK